ncbi:helix-turn-helix domain-containing protein [Sporomusa aerivorans]|uniref:helix-turn-helix domain-containing protein n=1 Tax=Sporomusa aerivorans TaxID=204936 RepID=UPI00352A042A
MEDKNITGIRVKQLRKNKGLTQKQLADMINVSPQVISNWERAYTPGISHDDLSRLASVLDTTTDYLTGISDERKLGPGIRSVDNPAVNDFFKTVVEEFQSTPAITPKDRQEIMEDLAEYFHFKMQQKKQQQKNINGFTSR